MTILIIRQTRRIANEQSRLSVAMEQQQKQDTDKQIKLAQRADKRAVFSTLVAVYKFCEALDMFLPGLKGKPYDTIKQAFEILDKQNGIDNEVSTEDLIVGEWYVPKHIKSCIEKIHNTFISIREDMFRYRIGEILTDEEKESLGLNLATIEEKVKTILDTKRYIHDTFERELTL